MTEAISATPRVLARQTAPPSPVGRPRCGTGSRVDGSAASPLTLTSLRGLSPSRLLAGADRPASPQASRPLFLPRRTGGRRRKGSFITPRPLTRHNTSTYFCRRCTANAAPRSAQLFPSWLPEPYLGIVRLGKPPREDACDASKGLGADVVRRSYQPALPARRTARRCRRGRGCSFPPLGPRSRTADERLSRTCRARRVETALVLPLTRIPMGLMPARVRSSWRTRGEAPHAAPWASSADEPSTAAPAGLPNACTQPARR